MSWEPMWMAKEREKQEEGGGGCQGEVVPTQREFQGDSKPLRPEALCFVTSLLEHNADANEEALTNQRSWWDGTFLLIFDTSPPPVNPLRIRRNANSIQFCSGLLILSDR